MLSGKLNLLRIARRALGIPGKRARKMARCKGFDQLMEAKAAFGEVLDYYSRRSKSSPFKHDIFVLLETGFKRNGFFVEFGAASGVEHSNTYLLEKEFGWKGILAEPAKKFHASLKRNRTCAIEFDCVWSCSGEKLPFDEMLMGELSSISGYGYAAPNLDKMNKLKKIKKVADSYEVNTISLNDLLAKHDAPFHIDYLSIDTEGSELEILQNFDFDKHQIDIITCEHHYTPKRQDIAELLAGWGYVRKFEEISRIDDWYVRSGA